MAEDPMEQDEPETEGDDDEFTGEVKEVEVTIKGTAYLIEVDVEDPDNLVIGSVTKVEGDEDVDSEMFTANLDDDDWAAIEDALEATETIEGEAEADKT